MFGEQVCKKSRKRRWNKFLRRLRWMKSLITKWRLTKIIIRKRKDVTNNSFQKRMQMQMRMIMRMRPSKRKRVVKIKAFGRSLHRFCGTTILLTNVHQK
jgi:hypothetical protein